MKFETNGNDLIIRVPLNVKPVGSKSGKSRIVASTSGFVSASTPFGTIKVGLNVITTDEDYGKTAPTAAPPKLVKAAGN